MSDKVKTRTITMTVYAIEASLFEITKFGDKHDTYLNGVVYAKVHGAGERHEWRLQPDQRCWIGDRVEVTVIEDEEQQDSTPLTPSPIDKR